MHGLFYQCIFKVYYESIFQAPLQHFADGKTEKQKNQEPSLLIHQVRYISVFLQQKLRWGKTVVQMYITSTTNQGAHMSW